MDTLLTEMIKVLFPGLPVIAETAFVTDQDKALRCGCSDILTKPFKKEDLLSAIRKQIRY